MSKNFICPFCNSSVPKMDETYRYKECYFNANRSHTVTDEPVNTNIFNIEMMHCPTCDNVSFVAKGEQALSELKISIYPNSSAKQFPKYIPLALRKDYEEAYSILELSPKASATLSRRCLQGMIRDFWNISGKNLYEEISKLQDKVPASQWNAIDAVRSIGNIGAHMEKSVDVIIDIDPNEAEQLIKLLELLFEKWYVARHDEELLLKSITEIKEEKVNLKNSSN